MKLNRIKSVFAEKGVSQIQLARYYSKSFGSVNAFCSNLMPTVIG